MLKHTSYPVAPALRAPERVSTARLFLRAWVILSLVMLFGHTAVYNLVGHTGAVFVLAAMTLASAAIWVPNIARGRPYPLEWRRFPWAVLAYGAFALLSTLWSQWPLATLLTGLLLAAITMMALMMGHMLTWREILLATSSALKWIVGLSVSIELWVALVRQQPLLPNFFDHPGGAPQPQWYWVEGLLFNGGRIQGIVGNANQLAAVCLVAIVLFGVLFAAERRRRSTMAVWIAVTAYLFVRAGSAAMFVAAAVTVFALVVALLIRRSPEPKTRTTIYAVALGTAAALAAGALFWRAAVLDLLDRSSDLTGRLEIWDMVLERAIIHPWLGWGFSSPWVPSEPAIHGWIIDPGLMTIFTAHNMWLDVFFQLGIVGVALMAIAWGVLLWRTWFFAVDHPRWDLKADRPFSPLTLAPTLICVVLLVQGLTESSPIMLWGWLFVALFSFKTKAVPLLGVGLSERERVIDRGQVSTRIP